MSYTYRYFFAIFTLMLAAYAGAQVSVSVTSSQSYDQALSYGGGNEIASWTFAATPDGNYGYLNNMSWSVDGTTMQSSATNQPFTYSASGPGLHKVSAYFSYAVGVTGTRSVAAIGGPLGLYDMRGSSFDAPIHENIYQLTPCIFCNSKTIWGSVPFDTTETDGAAYFNLPDYITYSWGSGDYPWTDMSWTFSHYYDGGTKATDVTGVPVGTYTVQMLPGGLSNSPAATVGQS